MEIGYLRTCIFFKYATILNLISSYNQSSNCLNQYVMKINIYFILFFVSAFIPGCQKDTTDLNTGKITAEMMDLSDCKENKSALTEGYNNNTSCIIYSYNIESMTLLLNHINAGFNCLS